MESDISELHASLIDDHTVTLNTHASAITFLEARVPYTATFDDVETLRRRLWLLEGANSELTDRVAKLTEQVAGLEKSIDERIKRALAATF